MKTLSISIHDPNNLGDQVCNPTDYFNIPDVVKVDAWDVGRWMYDTESNMIFGGGGLIHGILAQVIQHVQRNPNRKLIAWGLGHNQHGETTNDYGGVLDGFDLIGVRDFKRAGLQGWDYVPCASCMSPEFDLGRPPLVNYAVFQHFERPVVLRRHDHPLPVMLNDSSSLAVVIGMLTSANTVITNSYHGAYWSQLLERRVWIYKPFSSRFYDLMYQPGFCDENTWKQDARPALEGLLSDFRTLNRKFYEKVKTTLGIHGDRTADGGGDTRDSAVAESPVTWASIPEKPADRGEVPIAHKPAD